MRGIGVLRPFVFKRFPDSLSKSWANVDGVAPILDHHVPKSKQVAKSTSQECSDLVDHLSD